MNRQQTLAGTGALLRFMLRRDRIAIPVWVVSILLLVLATLSSFEQLYPTETARQTMAATMVNPAGIALTGPDFYLDNYTVGSMISHQMLGMAGIAVALMSIMLIVRHTRKEEESGCMELIRASVTGRHANTTAALLLVGSVNVIFALLLALGMGAMGIESVTWKGSFLFAAALGSIGIVFAAIAIVLVQFMEHARGATGLSAGVLVAAYCLRAVGDIGNNALSWLSPIGWAQQTSAYVDNKWVPLLLSAGLTTLLIVIAYPLSVRRDVGAGLMRPRRGRSEASKALTSPIGLAFRLQRINLIIWSLAMLVFGMSYGSFIGEAEEMMGSMGETIGEMLPEAGSASFADNIAGMFMTVTAILATIPALQSFLKLRSEENAGRVDALLSGALSRSRLLGSYLLLAVASSIVLMFMAGLGMGLTGSQSMNDSAYLPALIVAGLNFIPALWVAVGMAAALTGWLPRAAALSWITVVYSFFAVYLGGILQLPDWIMSLSPLYPIPRLPAAAFEWPPLLLLTMLAVALATIGWSGFRQRDLQG
ncbi:hypothetical protein B1A99_19170 [Cohnella sp. CIP 111063]|uniref:ABC transporter permease n=1 Tax=unclassified Cohnella TaxID=2636738 RepID=UPI000B8BDD85|nr:MULTISPECIES: hypothetical protein [unclassified Cohnella]OXS56972.1 hypothetical protein B1A99_19170 [Cohnella sp. CIP 111063]PRX69824.1 ABC-2 type transport system permease protein [Cohnella sp. SGD-V74]